MRGREGGQGGGKGARGRVARGEGGKYLEEHSASMWPRRSWQGEGVRG